MVSTQLKNISQNGNLSQIGVKIKNIWNHHLVEIITCFSCHFLVSTSFFHPNSPGHRPHQSFPHAPGEKPGCDAYATQAESLATTTSCIQICQESWEGTLRNFLHNSHFATQNSHNLKVAFWRGIFSGPSCFRILFLGCARRTKWTYIHKYSFSFGVGSDFQFLSEVAESRILVWMSWYHDILLTKLNSTCP